MAINILKIISILKKIVIHQLDTSNISSGVLILKQNIDIINIQH